MALSGEVGSSGHVARCQKRTGGDCGGIVYCNRFALTLNALIALGAVAVC